MKGSLFLGIINVTGTTLLPTLQLNRQFIGIEGKKEYVETAEKALKLNKIGKKIKIYQCFNKRNQIC